MKYENIAEGMHFFDFVFYETDAKSKIMYIFCPNCGQTFERKITSVENVKWIKENYRPCECFKYRGAQPKYKQTCYAHESLSQFISVAEFENRNGEAVLSAYWNTAEFGASHYDTNNGFDNSSSPYAFRRHPCYSSEKVIEMIFKKDGTVTYHTSIYIPMWSNTLRSGEWRQAARWRASSFVFDVISESLCELKGTNLEQYTADIEQFAELLSTNNNVDINLNEACVAFLALMHTSASAKKLWKSGYKNYVLNRVIETMLPRQYNTYYYWGYHTYEPTAGIFNWRGKTLERILKIEPQKLDLICTREDASVEELYGVQTIAKYGIEINRQNVSIVLAGKMKSGELARIFSETGFPISKMFKYIRHAANRKKGYSEYDNMMKLQSSANDYCDYLEMLKTLKTPFTKDVVFPTELKRSHDTVTATYEKLHNEQKDGAFKAAVKELSAIAYASDDFFIEPVKSATQLSKEANKMHNCSASYIDKVIDGMCAIFLIKQKKHPRTPFCMVELNLKSFEIVQNRAVKNYDAPKEAREFAKIWLNEIVKPYAATAAAV